MFRFSVALLILLFSLVVATSHQTTDGLSENYATATIQPTEAEESHVESTLVQPWAFIPKITIAIVNGARVLSDLALPFPLFSVIRAPPN